MNRLVELSEELARAVAQASQAVLQLRGTRFPACGVAWTANEAVTVAHVLGSRDHGAVILPSGEQAKAEVVGRDRSTDLALLRIEAELEVPSWSDASPQVGQLVLALGLGREHKSRATFGMVSGVSGAWKTRGGGEIDSYVEVDATLPHGFSGGPLVTVAGELIGVNSHRLLRGGATIPTPTVRRVLAHLSEHGGFRRGFLGVGVQAVALPEAVAAELGRARGVLITSVADGGPAAGAGLLLGDVLLGIDDVPLQGMEDLLAALVDRGNAEVSLQLLRAGERRTLAVVVGER